MEMNLEIIEAGRIGANAVIYYNNRDGVVVDPGGEGERIAAYVNDNGIKISRVLFTHGHFDHIGGSDDFKRVINVPALIFESEKELAENPDYNGSRKLLRQDIKADIDGTFTDGEVLEFNGFSLKVIHTPGHTAGCCCFYDKQNSVLLTGDTLFRQSIGRTDLHSGSYDALANSIRTKIFTLPGNTDIYPGHGSKTTVAFEKQNNPFVK